MSETHNINTATAQLPAQLPTAPGQAQDGSKSAPQRVPCELWTQIFSLACTDGGHTGCALSLVSRYFRSAVLPVQLHTVSLVTALKILKFAVLIERRPPLHRRVRHLYVRSCRKPEGTVVFWDDFAKAVPRILKLVAPGLVTLTSELYTAKIDENAVLSTHFPMLTELTVHGVPNYDISDDERNGTGLSLASSYSLPTLRYLHIVTWADSCPLYVNRAPGLTHLRLSRVGEVDRMDATLREEILDTLRRPSRTAERHNVPDETSAASPQAAMAPPSPRMVRIPKTLQQLVVHPGPSSSGVPTETQYRIFIDADMGNRLSVLDIDDSTCSALVRRGWEERISGGPGCWTRVSRFDTHTKTVPVVPKYPRDPFGIENEIPIPTVNPWAE